MDKEKGILLDRPLWEIQKWWEEMVRRYCQTLLVKVVDPCLLKFAEYFTKKKKVLGTT